MLGIYESDVSRLSELNLQLKLKRVKGVMRKSLSSSSLLKTLDAKVHPDPGSSFDVKVHPFDAKVHGPRTRFDSEVIHFEGEP